MKTQKISNLKRLWIDIQFKANIDFKKLIQMLTAKCGLDDPDRDPNCTNLFYNQSCARRAR